MYRLAAFVMRGRPHAVLAVVAASLVPLLGWFGAAVLALVTLRRGLRDGLLVGAGAAAALALIHQLTTGVPQLVLQTALEFWLPVLLLAAWLRRTVSLAGTIRLAAGIAAAAVVGFYLVYPDPTAVWGPVLDQVGSAVGSADNAEAWAVVRANLAPMLTGLAALSLLATVLVALLTARWMQSLLYYPGGFRREFHGLNLGRHMAVAVAGLLLAAALVGYGLVYDLALVVGSVFVLQTLALAHTAVTVRGLGRGWLVGLYVLLPLLFELMVVVGIADAAFDWRRRLLAGSGGNGAA